MLVLLLFCAGVVCVIVAANVNLHPLPSSAQADHVLVEKAARRLTLYGGGAALKTYRVSLGRAPIGRKQQEGDQRTPEGIYLIDRHKADSDFHRALHVSYPDQNDIDEASARGVSAGGDIMIHGIRNRLGWIGAFHRRRDWTAGCIAVTAFEIEEIWRAVSDGTPIEIRP